VVAGVWQGKKFDAVLVTMFAHAGPYVVVLHVFNVKGWLPVYWVKLNEALAVVWL